MRSALAIVATAAAVGSAHAERVVSIAGDTSVGAGAQTGATEQIMPSLAAFLGVRVALEKNPEPPTLRTCWMKPTPRSRYESVRSRCSSMGVSFAPQGSIERIYGDGEGMRAMVGGKLEVAIHYIVPRDDLGRFTLGARAGVINIDGELHPAWDIALGIDAGKAFTFGTEFALTGWQEPVGMRPSTTYFVRIGVMLGARL